MTKTQFITRALAILALCIGQALPLRADAPMTQIHAMIDRAMNAVREPGNGDDASRTERLREIAGRTFDFQEMAKRTMAEHWDRYRDRQDEFVTAFTRFVLNSYVSKIQSLKDEKMVYASELFDGTVAQVNTQLIRAVGDPMPIGYRLHRVGEEWKIYDVLIERISLVENFRSQFARVLKIASFDELLRKLQEKGGERGS